MKFTGRYDAVGGDFGVVFALAVFVFLFDELGVATSELIIGYVGVDTLLMQVVHIVFVGIAGVGGDDDAILIEVVTDAGGLIT